MAQTLEERRARNRARMREYRKKPGKREHQQEYVRQHYQDNKEGYLVRSKEQYQKDPARHKTQNQKRRRERPQQNRLRRIRETAKRKGLPFNLTLEDLALPSFCPVLGFPLVWNNRKSEFSAEVDRVVPSLGYVKGNVRVISRRANRLKNSAAPYELERIAAYAREAGEAAWRR